MHSQNYNKTGENRTEYTADISTNHIFTMTKTGVNYNPITIDVNLNKGKFQGGGNSYGWGTGNPVPAGWSAEIISVTNGATINGAKTAFTFSGKTIIKPVDDKTTPVFIINGCPSGIKDNIAPIKAVRFFISKFTFN